MAATDADASAHDKYAKYADEPVPGRFPLGYDERQWRSNTITVRERAMLMFINSVTDKPGWSRKVHDETIVAKWKTELDEMVANAGTEYVSRGGSILVAGFSDDMFAYCLRELRDKAVLYDTTANDNGEGGISVVLDTAAAVFKADRRVPTDVRAALLDAAAELEKQEPDWHPGSDNKVLDLVHPSLWPVVYGTTTQLPTEMATTEAIAHIGSGQVIPVPTLTYLGLGPYRNADIWSDRFQWLPCEVSFGPDGTQSAEVSSYINNAHPVHHAALYPVVGRVMDAALPMLQAAYDRVMSYPHEDIFDSEDLIDAAMERKRFECDDSNRKCSVPQVCDGDCEWRNMPEEEVPEGMTEAQLEREVWSLQREWFYRVHPVQQPEPKEYGLMPSIEFRTAGPWFPGAARRPIGPLNDEEGDARAAYIQERKKLIQERKDIISKSFNDYVDRRRKIPRPEPVRPMSPPPPRVKFPPEAVRIADDKRLQVIVKLANIQLTPDKPSYDGGSWHFEGQVNERIVATVLYYYDVENVTESRLAFRSVCDGENYNEGGFSYEQGDFEPFEILYGIDPGGLELDPKAQTIGDVATIQDRLLVFPNVLQHQVQPFSLADNTRPGHRKILALFLVDPAVRIPSSATVPPQRSDWREASAVDALLPAEITQMVYDNLSVPYPLDKAKELREELINERKGLQGEVEANMDEEFWSFCEH